MEETVLIICFDSKYGCIVIIKYTFGWQCFESINHRYYCCTWTLEVVHIKVDDSDDSDDMLYVIK